MPFIYKMASHPKRVNGSWKKKHVSCVPCAPRAIQTIRAKYFLLYQHCLTQNRFKEGLINFQIAKLFSIVLYPRSRLLWMPLFTSHNICNIYLFPFLIALYLFGFTPTLAFLLRTFSFNFSKEENPSEIICILSFMCVVCVWNIILAFEGPCHI